MSEKLSTPPSCDSGITGENENAKLEHNPISGQNININDTLKLAVCGALQLTSDKLQAEQGQHHLKHNDNDSDPIDLRLKRNKVGLTGDHAISQGKLCSSEHGESRREKGHYRSTTSSEIPSSQTSRNVRCSDTKGM